MKTSANGKGEMLGIALACARRGFWIFPCQPGTKKPATRNGYKDASNDEATIRAWWMDNPDCNVGIATGASGLTVLDIDAGITDRAMAMVFINSLPGAHYAVRTGRRPEFGLQIYFRGGDQPSIPWKHRFVTGEEYSGDIRSATGYVMAAGSRHPSGELYELINDPTTPPGVAPHWVRDWKRPERKNEDGTLRQLGPGDGQHDRMTQHAGRYRALGYDGDQILAALIPLNEIECVPPISDEDLSAIAYGVASRYAAGKPAGTITIGKLQPQPAPAKVPKRVRPEYPFWAWDGTVVSEFAKLCANDNNIPKKLYAEAFRCALGAVVGDRIACPGVEGALPRSYTIIVAPKGKGKGTAIRHAVKFFSQQWSGRRGSFSVSFISGLLSGGRDFEWKPKGIGAWMSSASSVPGMARLTKDLEPTIKTKPHMTWGATFPRILSVHEEMKTFLSTLFIEGGVGSGMEGVVCQLWDDVTFQGTATGTREAVYGEMLFSMLCGVTPDDWFDLLSRGDAVGGGLMSRLNIIGTEGDYENVSRMKPPDFADLRDSFLPRVVQLENAPVNVLPSEGADRIISEWVENLTEGSERMNIHVWRSAVLLAWLRREDFISEQTAAHAVELGRYQVASHEFYRTKSADTANARVQAKILRALEMHGPMSKRKLQHHTNAGRDGTDLWNRALDGLLRDGAVGKREDGTLYRAE
jgi:hypothetical protein